MMRDLELNVAGTPASVPAGWTISWVDQAAGLAALRNGTRSELCLLEGSGSQWIVTLRGRRIAVSVRSWREQALAAASLESGGRAGPIEIRAELPGLVVEVAVRDGDLVVAGAPLLTIEAMKMQNEIRAPRGGRVTGLAVGAGQTVAAGASLLRVEVVEED